MVSYSVHFYIKAQVQKYASAPFALKAGKFPGNSDFYRMSTVLPNAQ